MHDLKNSLIFFYNFFVFIIIILSLIIYFLKRLSAISMGAKESHLQTEKNDEASHQANEKAIGINLLINRIVDQLAKLKEEERIISQQIETLTHQDRKITEANELLASPDPHSVLESIKEKMSTLVRLKGRLERSRTPAGKPVEITEDGILCSILSFLKIREAVMTSVLSSRWENLWTYIPNLIFECGTVFETDPAEFLDRNISLEERQAVLQKRQNYFIESVNRVLCKHQGTGVKLFKVWHDLDKAHTHHLDQWVCFAVRSGASELVLCLYELDPQFPSTVEMYAFPCQLIDDIGSSSVECLRLSFCLLSPEVHFTGFSCLKTLHLHCTHIVDKDADVLLSVCPILENLRLSWCRGLVNLAIYHCSARLKSLIVSNCTGLLKIEFNSIILTSFDYNGQPIMLVLKNASRVTKASFQFDDRNYTMKYALTEISGILPHIEALSLFVEGLDKVGIIPHSYKFTHLKHLSLFTGLRSKDHFLTSAIFLNTSPLMETFEIHLLNADPSYEVQETLPSEQTHSNLKRFEITGFSGSEYEVELVLYVLKIATALEILTIDPNGWYYYCGLVRHRYFDRDTKMISKKARSQLLGKVRLGVRLVIR